MGKNKLAKFAEMETFPHVFQVASRDVLAGEKFRYAGNWAAFFGNDNPVILELGCGKGEYTVGLAARYPEMNFIGVDIKGARMWTGARLSLEKGLKNAAFLRTNIEMIHHFFASGEVSEIWLTFPDPQMKKVTKRLTATNFMQIYQKIVRTQGLIHLKTDSNFMFTYTREMVGLNQLPVEFQTDDLYATDNTAEVPDIKTYYEQQWLARGISIKYIRFRLPGLTSWQEPDIEIEKDSYRSFGRSQVVD